MSPGAPGDDTLTRFLREMAQRLPLDRVVEAHVFPPIRQGGAETGVAVIAARRMETVAAEEQAAAVASAADAATADAASADDAPPPAEGDAPVAPETASSTAAGLPERHTVFSARYRLTLKGPERGKWEVDVVEEADAPLVTVDAVVRGVQRRAGEGADPERFTAEQLRAVADGGEVPRP
jgi:hypothetical protein